MGSPINLENIKLFGIDVDGTLTDGLYTTDEDGKISKGFNTRDFYAISRLIRAGIEVVIVTGADDDIIEHKIRNSGVYPIQLLKDSQDKYRDLGDYLACAKLDWSNVAFIGDAENDLKVMDAAAWSACPRDAVPEVADLVYYVSEFNGGRAAVHDCIRKFFEKRGWPWVSEDYKC